MDNEISGFSAQGFSGASNSTGYFRIWHQDLPSTASGENGAQFREVKVCNNGKKATAHILMSKPIDD